jgi:hypothetical protein
MRASQQREAEHGGDEHGLFISSFFFLFLVLASFDFSFVS